MTNLLLLGFLPSGSEWIIIALVILLLFGGKKIPELMRGLGTVSYTHLRAHET